MKKYYVFPIAGLLLFSGCAWISPKQELPVETSRYVQLEKVIHPERIKDGGKLVVIPFRAGADVESTPELDKIALRIVKGVADKLEGQSPRFEVLLAEESRQAEFIIDGRVTRVSRSGSFAKWILRKKSLEVGISGRMTERKTGDTILVFNYKRHSEQKEEDFNHLGYILGQDIAQLLLSVNPSKQGN